VMAVCRSLPRYSAESIGRPSGVGPGRVDPLPQGIDNVRRPRRRTPSRPGKRSVFRDRTWRFPFEYEYRPSG
jgi:hypothetical protein